MDEQGLGPSCEFGRRIKIPALAAVAISRAAAQSQSLVRQHTGEQLEAMPRTVPHAPGTHSGGLLSGVLQANKFDTIGIDMTVADDAPHRYRPAGIWRRELHGNLITDQQIGREKYLHATAIQF